MIVQVVTSVLFHVVKSSLLHVMLMLFVKIAPHVPWIVHVMTMLQVAPHATHVKLNTLGLVVVNHVGYVSVIVRSAASGPAFPYVIVY